MFCLVSGCASAVVVEEHIPGAIFRSEPTAVLHPAGQAFALDPDRLQQEVASELRAAGFSQVQLVPQGDAGRGRATVAVRSELMARPLEENGLLRPRPSFAGERVRAMLEIRDERGAPVYRSVMLKDLSSALTEAKVAREIVRPLAP